MCPEKVRVVSDLYECCRKSQGWEMKIENEKSAQGRSHGRDGRKRGTGEEGNAEEKGE